VTPNLPILYSFRRCPYAMRARLALLASGLKSGVDYEHREVVLRDKPAELLAVSPKGTVPVLVLPNGEVIAQSLDIMLWALRQHDPYNWLEHAEDALAMIAQCDGAFKYHLDRYKYPSRYSNDIDNCGALAHRAKAAEFAAAVNQHMQNKSYFFDSCSGIYYAGYMPFLRQFSNVDKNWFNAQPWPALQGALADFEASTTFKTIMQPHPQWHPQWHPQ
jgi:glutathione S-transferase